jgi:hypothetical protein
MLTCSDSTAAGAKNSFEGIVRLEIALTSEQTRRDQAGRACHVPAREGRAVSSRWQTTDEMKPSFMICPQRAKYVDQVGDHSKQHYEQESVEWVLANASSMLVFGGGIVRCFPRETMNGRLAYIWAVIIVASGSHFSLRSIILAGSTSLAGVVVKFLRPEVQDGQAWLPTNCEANLNDTSRVLRKTCSLPT